LGDGRVIESRTGKLREQHDAGKGTAEREASKQQCKEAKGESKGKGRNSQKRKARG
jgi:hypothetical protein